MVLIQNTVNKKIIQNVDIEVSIHNSISQNVIDDLCKNSLRKGTLNCMQTVENSTIPHSKFSLPGVVLH